MTIVYQHHSFDGVAQQILAAPGRAFFVVGTTNAYQGMKPQGSNKTYFT